MLTLLRKRLKGYRTVLVMAPVVLLSLLDQLGAIDLQPILLAAGLTPAQASAAPGIIAFLSIVLRWITTTPLGQAKE